jgi:lactoylglutathione lyase
MAMRFHHFAIEVKDLETSIAFYQKYMALSEEARISFNHEEIVFLTSENFRLELISGGERHNSHGVHICFEVDTIATFNHNGLSAIEGPYKLYNGWETVFYHGPDQEVIEFLYTKKES